MTVFLSILFSLIILGILITVHELGHYTAGRIFGFGIREFAIGMGPRVFKKEKNGIVYSLRLLPIGGMCAFEGEDEEAKTNKCFNSFAAWKRAIVLAAGAFMNVVLAVVLAFVLLLAFGGSAYVQTENPVAMGFEQNSPAQQAGLAEGDVIIALDGNPVSTSAAMIEQIRAAEKGTVTLTVLRPSADSVYTVNGTQVADMDAIESYVNEHKSADEFTLDISGGETFDVTLTGIYDEDAGYNRIGVSISEYYGVVAISYNVWEAFIGSFDYIGDMFAEMFRFLGSLFTGGATINDMAGIVGVVDVMNDGMDTIIESGQNVALNIMQYILVLAVMLSANLGLINLLPFPALDGGRLVFVAIEAIFRKPVPAKVEAIIHFVGLVLLMVLIAVVFVNDIFRIVG